jgi:hypothetical protein
MRGNSRWLAYGDLETWEEYVDVDRPISLGRRRPRDDEWGDYIAEAQAFHIERLLNGDIDEPEPMTIAECVKRYALGHT